MKSMLQATSVLLIVIITFSSFTGKNSRVENNLTMQIVTDTVPAHNPPDSASSYTEAEFPGGKNAWMQHLIHDLRYPAAAMDNNIQGTVKVKFVVDDRGRLKELEAVSGPKELVAEAIRVIVSGGKWIPATVNGRSIRSEKEQTITFKREFPDVISPGVTDSVAAVVDTEASYPDGSSGWMRYLNRTFRYPEEAQRAGIQGKVTVAFTVDKDGNVSNIEAVEGPEKGGLTNEAVRVIRKSGAWVPARLNGLPVKSRKLQAITFKLESL